MATLREARARLLARLLAAGIDKPESERETDLILEHCCGLSKARQMADLDLVLGADAQEKIEQAVAQRERRVPLQYILGEQWFMGLRFHVRPGVLIPRADTETVVVVAEEFLRAIAQPVFVDIGTGSGAIAVALLKRVPASRAYALDISAPALSVARENAQAHEVAQRLELSTGDCQNFKAREPLDAVVSNPPYIPRSQAGELLPEVGVFEPQEALFGGGEDGLEFFKVLSEIAARSLRPGGLLAVEVGLGQAEPVAAIMRSAGLQKVEAHRDLNGISRCISAFYALDRLEK